MKSQAGKSIEQVIQGIRDMDLGPIKFKLMDPDDGPGWTHEYVEEMELAYRRFLMLVVKHPGEDIAPTRDIDTFWHAHILDTRKYAEDCQRVFGHFVHHYPYFGMHGEEESALQAAASEALHRLYRLEFGDLPRRSPAVGFTTAQSAHCVVARQAVEGAHCVVSQEAAAHCVVARPPGQTADAVHCVVASNKGQEDVAHCVVAREDVVHCVVSRESMQVADAAHCVVSQEAATHCVVAGQTAAHCVVAGIREGKVMAVAA